MTETKKCDDKSAENEIEGNEDSRNPEAEESVMERGGEDREEECAVDEFKEVDDKDEEELKILKTAELLMEKGDHASAGRLLKESLQKEKLSRDVRDEIEILMERLKPDPVALWIGLACLVLIAILALTTLGR